MSDASQLPGVVQSYHLLNQFRKQSKAEIANNLSSATTLGPDAVSAASNFSHLTPFQSNLNFALSSVLDGTKSIGDYFLQNADQIIQSAVDNFDIPGLTSNKLGIAENEVLETSVQKNKKKSGKTSISDDLKARADEIEDIYERRFGTDIAKKSIYEYVGNSAEKVKQLEKLIKTGSRSDFDKIIKNSDK